MPCELPTSKAGGIAVDYFSNEYYKKRIYTQESEKNDNKLHMQGL